MFQTTTTNMDNKLQIQEGFKLSYSQDPSLYFPDDLIDLVAQYTLKPPKEYCSVFMEKYTIFISKYPWRDILEITEERLIQLGCECKIKNFSIECIFYNEQRCVNMHFRVNIFTSSDSEDEYVVEFQRWQSGDTFEFMDLYAQFIKQDEGCGMVSRSKTGFLPQPRQMTNNNSYCGVSIMLNKDCLECLLRHLKSDYYETQVQGLCQLAQCVQTKANCVLIGRVPSIVSFLCSFIDIDCSEITYPTLIILKFLLNPSTNTSLMIEEQVITKIVSLLDKNLGETYENLIHSVIKPYFGRPYTSEDLDKIKIK